MNIAAFYFGNLCADALRCAKALESGDSERYQHSLARARKTLGMLRISKRPEAYEEGLLLIRGLECARESGEKNIRSHIMRIRIPTVL